MAVVEREEARPSVFADVADDMYVAYTVELEFDRWLMAGTPKDPKLMAGWIRSKAGVSDEVEVLEMMRRHMRDLGVTIPEDADFDAIVAASESIAEERHTCGFKANGHGLFIESRLVKSLLKEAVNIAYPYPRNKWGPTHKAPRGYLAEIVNVAPAEILLGRETPDGVHLWVGHPKGPQGRSSTLTYYEYVEKASVAFEIRVLEDAIKPEQWARIWTLAERQGLWALRSQGYGTFRVVKWERA